MAVENVERRSHPRIEIDGHMSYKIPGSDKVREGQLENLSADGARIWIGEELPTASEVLIQVPSDSQDEAGMTFRATLLYVLPRQDVTGYGYGCSIEAAADWPAQQAGLRLVKDGA